jgi:hypothetical protein
VPKLSAKLIGLGSLLVGGTALALGAARGDPDEAIQAEPRAETPAIDPLHPLESAEARKGDEEEEEEDDDDAPLVLTAPPLPEPPPAPPYLAAVPEDAFRKALAYQFNAPLFAKASAERKVVGHVRRSVTLPVSRIVSGDGCEGTWYEVSGLGYVCNSDGFSVSTDPSPLDPELHSPFPAVERPLPFRYAKLETQGAPSFGRIPSPEEEAEAVAGGKGGVVERLEGAVFIAVDRIVEDGDRRFVRTVRGHYLRESDLKMLEPTSMHGHRFDDDTTPIAFVHVETAALHDPVTLAPRGMATRYARFAVRERLERDGKDWVVGDHGLAIDREHVRIAELVERHERIPADTKWVHVNLKEQTLVAYEGARPVLATLVSGGTEGFEAPLGVYRVHKKHVTRTMAGPDPDAGRYEVAEVPWTMYYWGSYALHGAYWHDDFGNVRSHGCTNIPPHDARWLFYWSEPEIPRGWHATFGRLGPWLYFTRG